MSDPQRKEIEHKIIEAITEVVRGTDWAPPEGGILVDALIVMIHADTDGEYGTSWLSQGSTQQAEGMAAHVMRSIELQHKLGLEAEIRGLYDE